MNLRILKVGILILTFAMVSCQKSDDKPKIDEFHFAGNMEDYCVGALIWENKDDSFQKARVGLNIMYFPKGDHFVGEAPIEMTLPVDSKRDVLELQVEEWNSSPIFLPMTLKKVKNSLVQ